MVPNPKTAPSKVVLEIRIRTDAINSTIPEPILPKGSIPNVENIYTLSGAAVNLKNNVCNKMTTAISLTNQTKNDIFIIQVFDKGKII